MGTHLILVTLLSLCSLSFSQECRKELLENVDLPGTNITVLYSPDVKHCQQLCTQHPSCLFFTFIRPDWTEDNRHFYCYLRSTISGQPDDQTLLLGVTSGFSLKTCKPHTRLCHSQVYKNVDFLGADYRSLFTADYEECQRACTHDPGCQFFTFVNEVFTPEVISFRYKCHLKFSWRVPRIPIIEKNFGVISGFSQKAEITQYFACQGKLLSETEIVGNDMEMLFAVSPEQCQALCSAHPLCTYFSYSSDNFKCYLKNNPSEMVTRSMEGVTSGMPERFCQLNSSWVKDTYERIDFRGSEMGYELMEDPDTCRKKCTENPNCQFYTYIPDLINPHCFRRRCTLKRVITMPAPPKVTKLPNVVSGFSLEDCFQIA
ncbi:hypothetical protein PAMP_007837 [Pampus punctatissimus]